MNVKEVKAAAARMSFFMGQSSILGGEFIKVRRLRHPDGTMASDGGDSMCSPSQGMEFQQADLADVRRFHSRLAVL
jgi:hypothetical protein